MTPAADRITFDRMRPRSLEQQAGASEPHNPTRDMSGRAALYSVPWPGPGLGRVAVSCSACQQRSVVTYLEALRLAVPSLPAPLLRNRPNWWMRCPACRRREWVTLALW